MKKILFFIAAVLLPFMSQAHGYWIEIQGKGTVNEKVKVRIFFGEFENQKKETGKLLDKISEIKMFVINANTVKTELKMVQTLTHWEGEFTPESEGIYQIVGINDTRAVQDWTKHNLGVVRPIQYLRAHYYVGKSSLTTKIDFFDLDAISTVNNGIVSVSASLLGKPFSKNTIKVYNPKGWGKDLKTDEMGETTFVSDQKGTYLIILEYMDNTPGNYNELAFQSKRYRSEITIFIP